jgi:hypothetical protein
MSTVDLCVLVETSDFTALRVALEGSEGGSGVSVDMRNASGDTALHVASAKLLLHAAEYLLSRGANPNSTNDTGATPLHKLASSPLARDWMLHQRAADVAQVLVRHGGDAGVPNKFGVPPVAMVPVMPASKLRTALEAGCGACVNVAVERLYAHVLIGREGTIVEALRRKHAVAIDTIPA